MPASATGVAPGWRRSVDVQIRVGLNFGEVVVRSIGSDLHMDYTAVGQTTHLAARMEQLAAPGTIRLTVDTLRLAEGYVEVGPLGPVPITGSARRSKSTRPPGRVWCARAYRQRPRAVSRVSSAGTWRSRSCTAPSSRRAPGMVSWWQRSASPAWESRGPSTSSPLRSRQGLAGLAVGLGVLRQGDQLSPVVNLLKAYFKLYDREAHNDIRGKVTGTLTLDRALEPALPALLALLDVPLEDTRWADLDPPQRRQRTLDAVKRLLLRESQVQPLLVVFETLHWTATETRASWTA